jgi:tetratricopeptide (TPR) repeat protein
MRLASLCVAGVLAAGSSPMAAQEAKGLQAKGLAQSSDDLQAMRTLKEANQAFQQGDYKKAAQLYEETIKARPELTTAYFYLANSYENQFTPSRKGEPDNDALLTRATELYQLAADKLSASDKPGEKRLGALALAYLVVSYGPDKLNDPSKAEPILRRMIELDPGEPANYFALAKIYEDMGALDRADQMIEKVQQAKPDDPDVYTQIAAYFNRQGQFEKTIAALNRRVALQPENAEAFYTIATTYWDKAYHDAQLKEPQKKELVLKGIEAADRALAIKADYMEALTFKGLLLLLEAGMENDLAKQRALKDEADRLRDRAQELRKKKGVQ